MLWVPTNPVSVSLKGVEGRLHCSLLPQRSGPVRSLHHSPRYTVNVACRYCLVVIICQVVILSPVVPLLLILPTQFFCSKQHDSLLIRWIFPGKVVKSCKLTCICVSNSYVCLCPRKAAACLRTVKLATMEHGKPMITSLWMESIAQSVVKAGVEGTVKVSCPNADVLLYTICTTLSLNICLIRDAAYVLHYICEYNLRWNVWNSYW